MKNNKGVILIALIITIIVLLILAGIGITMVAGQNGILSRAQEAKTTTQYRSSEEKVKLSVSGAIAKSNYGELTIVNLKEEVEKYNGTITGGTEFPVIVTIDGYGFEVDGNGNVIGQGEKISKDESYVGYYADMDADGTVDGIIYADLAIGGSGIWGEEGEMFNIPTITNGLKDYYISKKDYEDVFGVKDVISPIGEGTERFYIMALKDVDGQQNGTEYDWYNAANRKNARLCRYNI